MSRTVEIRVVLTAEEARAFSEFLKRVQPDDYRRRAVTRAESNLMMEAGMSIKTALDREGVVPR